MRPIVTNFTVGADPEMFIIDNRTKEVVSSIGLIPGEKGDPWKDESWPEGFGIEIDNILAEFNIPPVKTKEDFINNLNFMKSEIDKFVKKQDDNLGILCTASKMVSEDQLQHPIAKLFGCSVDYNAYKEGPNPKPKGESTNLRSAGFHIHLGYANKNTETSLEIIKNMDVFLGLPSVIFDRDRKRRSLYGKAGCFRLTPYGLEYRVLSSKMYSTDALMSLVWDGIILSIKAYNMCIDLSKYKSDVVKAINTSNKKLAISTLLDINSNIKLRTINNFIDKVVKEEI